MSNTTSSLYPSATSVGSDLHGQTSGGDVKPFSNEPRKDGAPLSRVVQGAHETVDRLADAAAPIVQRLEAGAESASKNLQAQADTVRKTAAEWTDSLRSTVSDNPLSAVATAFALGLLVARVTR